MGLLPTYPENSPWHEACSEPEGDAKMILTACFVICRNRRVTKVQAQVRMWLARTRFRRTTELGRKAAVRAAKVAERDTAALVLQKYARRRIACKLVRDYALAV